MGFSLLLEPQNAEVGRKLFLATLCMFVLPVSVYFGAYYYLFQSKEYPENWAGGAAIVVVNLIVGGYCYVALVEDSDIEEDNDASAPRVGIYKQRTD